MAIYSGFVHWKWRFAIAMLNYQRVSQSFICKPAHGQVNSKSCHVSRSFDSPKLYESLSLILSWNATKNMPSILANLSESSWDHKWPWVKTYDASFGWLFTSIYYLFWCSRTVPGFWPIAIAHPSLCKPRFYNLGKQLGSTRWGWEAILIAGFCGNAGHTTILQLMIMI